MAEPKKEQGHNVARSAGVTLRDLHERAVESLKTGTEQGEEATQPDAIDPMERALSDARKVQALELTQVVRRQTTLESQVAEAELASRLTEVEARRVQAEAEVQKSKLELQKLRQGAGDERDAAMVRYIERLEGQLDATREEIRELREAGRQAELATLKGSLDKLEAELERVRSQPSASPPQEKGWPAMVQELREARLALNELKEEFLPQEERALVSVDGQPDVAAQVMLLRAKTEMDRRDRALNREIQREDEEHTIKMQLMQEELTLKKRRVDVVEQNLPLVLDWLQKIGQAAQEYLAQRSASPQGSARPAAPDLPVLPCQSCGFAIPVAAGQNMAVCPQCRTVYHQQEAPAPTAGPVSGEEASE